MMRFERSNRIKYFFRNEPEREKHPFHQISTWQPPKASQEIEAYLNRIKDTINDHTPRKMYPNLSQEEKLALTQLAKDDTIIIKSADKGSGIVVEDRDKYVEAGKRHLSDTSIYETSDSDPTEMLGGAINQFVHGIHKRGIIDDKTKEFLTFKTDSPPKTQQLYFLKKIHKNPISERPIVSGCGGPTERISQLVDLHLQPFVPLIKSHVKDSGHMINIIENTPIPPNCTIATIDVKALYLNIPHDEGIQAVLNTLYRKNEDPDSVTIPPGTMKDLLSIVLTKNYFQFADQMYHQIQGTAMGTKMAPAYANIFMAELEDRLLDNYHTKPILWKRYIDDVLCIWPGSQEDFSRFVDYLNESHHTIKFTYDCSQHTVDFLDLTIYKGERYGDNNILDIKPYFKKTNKFQYLQYSSAHPKRIFSSLLKGELTRLLRACSNKEEYIKTTDKICQAFRERNYPPSLIKSVRESVPYENRPQTLLQTDRGPCPFDTFLVVEYTPDLDTKSLQTSLKPTTAENEHIPKACLSMKIPKNLSKLLVRAKLKNCTNPPVSMTPVIIPITPSLDGSSAGCGLPNCKCCTAMSRKLRITSTYNYKSFWTPKHANCNTSNVIYLLECNKCKTRNQYVGQTRRTLSQRLAGHRAASRVKHNLPLYKHFTNSPEHSFERDIRISILEKSTTEQLDARERHWINTLDTVFPKGLNSRYE